MDYRFSQSLIQWGWGQIHVSGEASTPLIPNYHKTKAAYDAHLTHLMRRL